MLFLEKQVRDITPNVKQTMISSSFPPWKPAVGFKSWVVLRIIFNGYPFISHFKLQGPSTGLVYLSHLLRSWSERRDGVEIRRPDFGFWSDRSVIQVIWEDISVFGVMGLSRREAVVISKDPIISVPVNPGIIIKLVFLGLEVEEVALALDLIPPKSSFTVHAAAATGKGSHLLEHNRNTRRPSVSGQNRRRTLPTWQPIRSFRSHPALRPAVRVFEFSKSAPCVPTTLRGETWEGIGILEKVKSVSPLNTFPHFPFWHWNPI